MDKKQKRTNRFEGNKAFYIIFSIIASIALWMYVAYQDNSDKDVPIYGIPVEVTGQELLADHDLVVTDISAKSITARFSGKRNTIAKLSPSNVKAVLDLSSILRSGNSGEYQLSYTFEFGNNISASSVRVLNASDSYISVHVERLVSEPVTVIGYYGGGIKEGYIAETLEVSPEVITVSGPQSIVSKIKSAYAELRREDLSETATETVPVVLKDQDDKTVSSEYLTFSSDTVTITQRVLMVKEVPLKVNLIESNAATEENTMCDIFPKTVMVSGDPAILGDLNTISVGTVNLTDFATSADYTFPIALPNETNNISGETTASVSVEIFGLSTRRLSANNIQVKNVKSGYNANIITQSLDVLLRGKESDLDNVLPENVRIVADLSEIQNTTGTMSVPASVSVDGNNFIDSIGDYVVTVTISKF